MLASNEVPSKSIQQIKESIPVIIGAVGEEVELRCPATGAPGIFGEAQWEKVNGELPYAYSIRQNVLHLKDIKRKDSGIYKCTMRTDSDFVPFFNGDGYVELKPLTDEQWSNISIKISFKPKVPNGLLLYTERKNDDLDKINNYLSVGLKNGHVVYRFNVGAGSAELKSKYPIVMDEWHRIEIINQPSGAALMVDEDDANEQANNYFNTGEGASAVVSVGGTKHKDDLRRTTFDHPFVGTITSLLISDESIDFGENIITKSPKTGKDMACSLGLCQHRSICIPTNVHKGFVCDCATAKGYDGEFCERKILKCDRITCEVGTCENRPDGRQFCRCPPGRYGDRCQLLEDDQLIESISFNGDNSYITLPRPQSLRNFSLKMEIVLRSTKDQLLAIVATDYNPKRANYLALAIRRGKFVHLYNSGDGNMEVESLDEVKLNVPYHLDLKRFGNRAELRINGTKIPSRGKLSAFVPGTNLFIGGVPSGVTVNSRIGGAASFRGCISKIVINGKDVNLVEILKKSSHDVTVCKLRDMEEVEEFHMPFIWSTPSTTRTTIRVTTSTYRRTTKITEEKESELEMEDVMLYPDEETAEERAPCTNNDCTVQCEPDTCGDHGDCEIINGTVICFCHDYYDGPNCEIFKPIEHAAKFDGNAFIVFSIDDFPHLTSEHEENLSLRFKTSALSGLIFWQGQQIGTPLKGDDYMSIGLSDGHLVFSYELGGGAAQLISTEVLNDDKEHHVQIWRKGREGKMVIDDGIPVTGSSLGILAMLNVDSDVYIGGLPNLDEMTGGLYEENFVGCIGDITLNGVKMDLMANAIDGRNVKPCDQWTARKRWLRSRKYHR
uniref:EGF-like domain-containing protein n=1 Tax=Setaria digitata TaxID=48799 RepID=A0A915PXY9_9BILA